MSGFFGKIFGSKKGNSDDSVIGHVGDLLNGLIEAADLDLSFDIEEEVGEETRVSIEIYGGDEELLRARDGQLLDAIQLFLTRAVQHQMRDERVTIHVDNSGFREQANSELTQLAEKLKNIALEKGKPVYFRALPPRDRKIIHQYLAEDGRVKSRSVGDGLYKKIKIYPLKNENNMHETPAEQF